MAGKWAGREVVGTQRHRGYNQPENPCKGRNEQKAWVGTAHGGAGEVGGAAGRHGDSHSWGEVGGRVAGTTRAGGRQAEWAGKG